MIFEIHEDLCINCGSCRRHCPFEAIPYDMQHRIDADLCTGCTLCYAVCPVEDCITLVDQPAAALSDSKRTALRSSLLQNNSYWSKRTLTAEVRARASGKLRAIRKGLEQE
jgi:MinD superfamily P-loop ATPase